jgi:hypothetical protein
MANDATLVLMVTCIGFDPFGRTELLVGPQSELLMLNLYRVDRYLEGPIVPAATRTTPAARLNPSRRGLDRPIRTQDFPTVITSKADHRAWQSLWSSARDQHPERLMVLTSLRGPDSRQKCKIRGSRSHFPRFPLPSVTTLNEPR